MNSVIDYLEKHWALSMSLGGFAVSVVHLFLDKRYGNKARVDDIHARQAELSERMGLLEREIKHLPTAQDVAKMRLLMEEMRGDMKVLHATIKALSERLQDKADR